MIRVDFLYLCLLQQLNAVFFAVVNFALWPNGRLHFADVCFLKQEHTQTALAYTATDGQWQCAVNNVFVEIEFKTVKSICFFQLFHHTCFVNTDTH